MIRGVQKEIEKLHAELVAETCGESVGDTMSLISRLGSCAQWSDYEDRKLFQLAKSVEISHKLKEIYSQDNEERSGAVLDDRWMALLYLIALRRYFEQAQEGLSIGVTLKRVNTLLKLYENVTDCIPKRLACNVNKILMDDISRRQMLQVKVGNRKGPSVNSYGKDIRVVPLTIVYSEGPIARSYLAALESINVKPSKIVQIVSSMDVFTKKPVGKLLPQQLRLHYADYVQRSKMLYWPRKLQEMSPGLISAIQTKVADNFGFEPRVFEGITKPKPLENYSDQVDRLMVNGLADPVLAQCLATIDNTLVYTGGGMVPASLIDVAGRIIHIHPGYLPDIRGADCALWSCLITGHASASAFYMSVGIDEGDIIDRQWLPRVQFDAPLEGHDSKFLYRAIYSHFDPWVRSYLLRKVVLDGACFESNKIISQSPDEGVTYHFMHSSIQKLALGRLFQPDQSSRGWQI